jgi:hypothetical protein
MFSFEGIETAVQYHVYSSPERRGGQRHLSPLATNLCEISWRENSDKWWAKGIDWQKMYENLGCDFVRQGQDRVFVGLEPLLQQSFLSSECGKGAFKILGFDLYICEASAIGVKGTDHHSVWRSAEVLGVFWRLNNCFHQRCDPSERLQHSVIQLVQ